MMSLSSFRAACARQTCAFRQPRGGADPCVPVAEESVESLPLFAEMGELGLLTSDSQEGRTWPSKEAPRDMRLWRRAEIEVYAAFGEDGSAIERVQEAYARLGGTTGEACLREKAYLNGFMERDRAIAVTDRFNARTDKIAWVVSRALEDVDGHMVPVTFWTFGDGGEPSIFTVQDTCIPESVFRSSAADAGIAECDLDELAYVTFLDPKAGRAARDAEEGLFRDVIEALG